MNRLLETTRMQDRGVVTIPEEVRLKLGLEKGSTLVFIETEDGRIEVRALAPEDMDVLDSMGAVFLEQGIDAEQWLTLSRRSRRKLFQQRYPGLS